MAEIPDLASDVQFTLSPIGLLRREAREIAYAAEICRLRNALNCIAHEGDNFPPDAESAVRIAREALR